MPGSRRTAATGRLNGKFDEQPVEDSTWIRALSGSWRRWRHTPISGAQAAVISPEEAANALRVSSVAELLEPRLTLSRFSTQSRRRRRGGGRQCRQGCSGAPCIITTTIGITTSSSASSSPSSPSPPLASPPSGIIITGTEARLKSDERADSVAPAQPERFRFSAFSFPSAPLPPWLWRRAACGGRCRRTRCGWSSARRCRRSACRRAA